MTLPIFPNNFWTDTDWNLETILNKLGETAVVKPRVHKISPQRTDLVRWHRFFKPCIISWFWPHYHLYRCVKMPTNAKWKKFSQIVSVRSSLSNLVWNLWGLFLQRWNCGLEMHKKTVFFWTFSNNRSGIFRTTGFLVCRSRPANKSFCGLLRAAGVYSTQFTPL